MFRVTTNGSIFYVSGVFGGNHLVGTCKMGTDAGAVVSLRTARARTWRIIRVIDASIIPNLISAHTNAIAFAIGEKGSDLVLGRVSDTV